VRASPCARRRDLTLNEPLRNAALLGAPRACHTPPLNSRRQKINPGFEPSVITPSLTKARLSRVSGAVELVSRGRKTACGAAASSQEHRGRSTPEPDATRPAETGQRLGLWIPDASG